MVVSEFDGKYWWMIVPDDVWERKEMMGYYEGIPIFTTWSKG